MRGVRKGSMRRLLTPQPPNAMTGHAKRQKVGVIATIIMWLVTTKLRLLLYCLLNAAVADSNLIIFLIKLYSEKKTYSYASAATRKYNIFVPPTWKYKESQIYLISAIDVGMSVAYGLFGKWAGAYDSSST